MWCFPLCVIGRTAKFKCAAVLTQGEVVHWLACSLYAACRKGSTPTVGKGLMEGNCVSLTRILRTAKLRSVAVGCAVRPCSFCWLSGFPVFSLCYDTHGASIVAFIPYRALKGLVVHDVIFPCPPSLIQFFSKMRKWANMSNLSQDFRLRMERLERNFEVSTVIFRKFEPIFMDMFQNPQGGDPPRQPRSRKHRHGEQTHRRVCVWGHPVLSDGVSRLFISAGGCPVTSVMCSSSAGLCLSTPKVPRDKL